MNLSTFAFVTALVATPFSAVAKPVIGQGTWEKKLLARDLDGNFANGPEAFYDTQLKITWLRASSGEQMHWYMANAWAGYHFGLGGWRLPKTFDFGSPGCDDGYDCGSDPFPISSEMAHLYFVTLGNKARWKRFTWFEREGWGLSNTGYFQNLQAEFYWSDTEFKPFPSSIWTFDMHHGFQNREYRYSSNGHALAVHDGDVGVPMPVPEPATHLLALLGLGAVGITARRRKSAWPSNGTSSD